MDIKLKQLKPSIREKKRYLLLETEASKSEIEQALLHYIGILEYAKAAPAFVKNNILVVNREYVDKIRASLALASKLIKVKRVSGTLKGLRDKE